MVKKMAKVVFFTATHTCLNENEKEKLHPLKSKLTSNPQDYDGSLERLAKESDCLKQVFLPNLLIIRLFAKIRKTTEKNG